MNTDPANVFARAWNGPIEREPKLKRITLIAITLIGLTGCAEFNAFKSGVATHGAEAADQTVEVSIWSLCEASSVGSIKRRFKTDEERHAYNAMCEGQLP